MTDITKKDLAELEYFLDLFFMGAYSVSMHRHEITRNKVEDIIAFCYKHLDVIDE